MSMKRHIPGSNCCPRLPHRFPTSVQVGLGTEGRQVSFLFREMYRAHRQRTPFYERSDSLMRKTGRLQYCIQRAHWNLHNVYDKPVPMHCGECFEIQMGSSYLLCCIERDAEWFVIFNDHTKFHLHPKVNYNVRTV